MKRALNCGAAPRGFRVRSRRDSSLNNGGSGDNCRSPQEPHNDQNRTTPGTNLLPSINHARVKPTFVRHRCRGPGMGGSQVRVFCAYGSVRVYQSRSVRVYPVA